MNNPRTLKRVAAINDISCFGKCSLTVSIPVLSRFGVEAVPLPTAILSTHTGGFTGFTCLNMTDEMEKIIAHWNTFGLELDCVYTGYLLGMKQLKIVEEFTRAYKQKGALALIDPVMGDNGRLYTGFDEAYVGGMRSLVSVADIVTPNITEAAFLTGMLCENVHTPEYVREVLARLLKLGAKYAVVTGVRPDEDRIGNVCMNERGEIEYEGYVQAVKVSLHGCGDVFASALCALALNGVPLKDAVRRAANFTDACIRETEKDIDNHWYGLKFETSMGELPESAR